MKRSEIVVFGLLLILSSIVMATFDPEDGLFAYMPMDDAVTTWVYDTHDNFGGELKGFSSAGTSTVWIDGKFGKCFYGNGVQNRIALAAAPDTDTTTALGNFQNKTVSMWICPNAAESPAGATVQFIFGLFNGTDQPYKFYLVLNNGAMRIQGAEGRGVDYALPVIDGNTWYHIVALTENTEDGLSELRLYVNGVLRSNKTSVARDEVGMQYYPSLGAAISDMALGDLSRQAFYGRIDDFRIYDKVLSIDEINELMGYVPQSENVNKNRYIELYYTFDEDSGDIVVDSSKNEMYGLINNYDGSETQWVNGVYDQAFDFDGTTNSMIFKDRNNEFDFGPFKHKTISFWIKPNKTEGIQQVLNIIPASVDDQYKYYLYLQEDRVRFQGISIEDGNTIMQSTTVIPTNEWTHIAIVIRECTDAAVCCQMFINGLQDYSGFQKTYKNSDCTRAYAFTLAASQGHIPANTESFYDGLIDDFRVYSKDFSPSDVNDIYSGGPIVYGDVDQDSDVDENDLHEFAGTWIDSTVIVPATTVLFSNGDFEDYIDQSALESQWTDWGVAAASGSTSMSLVTLLTDSADTHSGDRALRWQYNTIDNSGYNLFYTDILYALPNPLDLTEFDYLSVWIKRAEGNAQQSGLYVKFLTGGLDDTNIAATYINMYEEGSTALPLNVWHNWIIDLNDLLYNNSDYLPTELDDVRGLVFGCYDGTNNPGIGTIDIDDIELLTASVCSELYNADFNGDGVVDMGDYSTLAKSWMSN